MQEAQNTWLAAAVLCGHFVTNRLLLESCLCTNSAALKHTFDQFLFLKAVTAVNAMLLQQPLQLLHTHTHQLTIACLYRLRPGTAAC